MLIKLLKNHGKNAFLPLGLTSLCMAPQVAFAASDKPVEEIIITAARTEKPINAIPNSVRIIDKELLETQLSISTSLLDSLSFSIPSMTPGRQKMTSSSVTLRGRTPLYLLDGIPQSTPLRNGERSGFTVDPAFIERVEVIYGANAIQGVGATGGVINAVTVAAPENGDWLRRFAVDLTADNFESNGYHTKTSALVGKKFGVNDMVLGASLDKRDLYYDGDGNPVAVDTTQGDTMDSVSWNLFAKWGYDFSANQRLVLSGSAYELEGDGDYRTIEGSPEAGIPASSEKGQSPGDPTRNEAVNLALNYRDDDLAGGIFSAQAYYYDFYALYGGDTFDSFQDTSIAPMGELFDQSALSSEKLGSKFTYIRDNVLWQDLQTVVGLDYLVDETFQELAQTGRLWVPKMEFTSWAPFVQLEQKLLDEKLRLSAGARYENVSLDVPTFTTIAGANNTEVQGDEPSFEQVLGNAGAVFNLTEDITLFASFAEGFTMPDAGLILRSVSQPGQSVSDLVDLQPVIADNTEVGINFKARGMDLSASYFQSYSKLGSRIQVVDGSGQIRREKTEIDGIEIAARYDFQDGSQLGANYAHLNGRYDSDGDNRIDRDLDGRNISPNRLNLWAQTQWGSSFSGRVQMANLFDREFEGGEPEHDFNGYRLFDIFMKYQHENYGEFSLGIQNALNEQYITYYAQTVTFVNENTYVSGRGRVFNLGWKTEF